MRNGMHETPGGPGNPGPDATAGILQSTGISIAIAFAIASFYPPPLLLSMFVAVTLIGAVVAAIVAALSRMPVWAETLTLWDKAALLTFVGLTAALFIDREAVQSFVEASQAGALGLSAGDGSPDAGAGAAGAAESVPASPPAPVAG